MGYMIDVHSTNDSLVTYDEHGVFEVLDPSMLQAVGGATLDGVCRGNVACNVSANVGACVTTNAACGLGGNGLCVNAYCGN